MKCNNSSATGLSFLILAFGTLAFAGGVSQGGGFYGKSPNGEWVLVDELEEGVVKDPRKLPEFEQVEKLLKEISDGVPQFAEELRAPLRKTWHFVDFTLKCESPRTPVNTELMAGACQDDQDVWVEKSKFSLSKSKLILHELLQGVRLAHNRGNEVESITPAQVRAVFRALGRGADERPEELQEVLSLNGFGTYSTAHDIASEEAALKPYQDAMARADRLRNAGYCNLLSPIVVRNMRQTPADPTLLTDEEKKASPPLNQENFWIRRNIETQDALTQAVREADWISNGGEPAVSFSAREVAFEDLRRLREVRGHCQESLMWLLKVDGPLIKSE